MKSIIILTVFLIYSVSVTGLRPDRIYVKTPKDFKMTYNEVNLISTDGYNLMAWIYIPPIPPRNITIILSNGDAGNMSYYIYYANQLATKGYHVLTYDYRGFGESSKYNINEKSLYLDEFVTDLKTAIKYSKSTYPSNRVCLWGLSMGTIISVLASDTTISYIIGDSFVKDPIELCDFYKNRNKHLIIPLSANNYQKALHNISTPILIFSGRKDLITTLNDAKKIVNDGKNRKLIIYDGNHLDAFKCLELDIILKHLNEFFIPMKSSNKTNKKV